MLSFSFLSLIVPTHIHIYQGSVVQSIHCTTVRTVKTKTLFFVPFRPSFTPCVQLPSRVQNYFFPPFHKKKHERKPISKLSNLKTRRGKHRNVFTRCGEGHETGTGCDQRSLEQYAHGRESQEKGDTKTYLFCGLSHYFRVVRSRDHLGVGNGSKKVQWYNPYPEQDTSQRGGQEIIGEWTTWRWHRRGKVWQKGSHV